ncbi:MAG: GntR family transcriptional regulator [Actinomycetota bacterium]
MAPLSDMVHRELKKRLILWDYLPAERLGEEALAREFKVSRTPVRDALRRLEREGFLEHRSWAGYQVPKPDLPRIKEHYEVRLILEVATVRRLAGSAPPEQLDELLQQWSVPGDQIPATDPELVYQDEAFHERLAEIAGNATLLAMLRSINEHIRIIRSADFVTAQRVLDTYRQHRAILAAIRRGDAGLAAGRMAEHISESEAQVEEAAARALARILTKPNAPALAQPALAQPALAQPALAQPALAQPALAPAAEDRS